MRLYNLALSVGVLISCCASVFAESLVFVPQMDVGVGATNYSWFEAANWFQLDGDGSLAPAGRVPKSSETVMISGTVDLGATGIRVQSLILSNNASILNGTFSAEQISMWDGSSFKNSTINLLSTLHVAGTNCTLDGVLLNVLANAWLLVDSGSSARPAGLLLTHGASVANFGLVSLNNGAVVRGAGEPQSRLSIQLGAVLSVTNQAWLRGDSQSALALDNSGRVEAVDGTLTFENGIEWQSGAGAGAFAAVSEQSQLLFLGKFEVPSGVVDHFSGAGISRFAGGATVDGTVQVGIFDPSQSGFLSGALEITESVDGAGLIDVLGDALNPASLVWKSGTLSLLEVRIESGAKMRIMGTENERSLVWCSLNNGGECVAECSSIQLGAGGVINNAEEAVFEVLNSCVFSGGSTGGTGSFENRGRLYLPNAGQFQFGIGNTQPGPDLNNLGLVDLASGQLTLSGGKSAGEFRIGQNAELRFWNGTYALNTGASFTGPGWVRLKQTSGSTQWIINGPASVSQLELGAQGIIDGPGFLSVSQLMLWTAGTLKGNGGVTIAPSGTLSIEGTLDRFASQRTVNNYGKTIWTGQGVVRGNVNQKATLNNLPGATLDLQTDKLNYDSTNAAVLSINNGGVLLHSTGIGLIHLPGDFSQSPSGVLRLNVAGTNSTKSYSSLTLPGNASLSGTLELVFSPGTSPVPGDQFRVLDAAVCEGRFLNVIALAPPRTAWVSRYSSTNVILALAPETSLQLSTVSGGALHFSVPTTIGLSYVIERSATLYPPYWLPVAVLDGNGNTRMFSDPITQAAQFYRVHVQ